VYQNEENVGLGVFRHIENPESFLERINIMKKSQLKPEVFNCSKYEFSHFSYNATISAKNCFQNIEARVWDAQEFFKLTKIKMYIIG
jgi:hypothetical protein